MKLKTSFNLFYKVPAICLLILLSAENITAQTDKTDQASKKQFEIEGALALEHLTKSSDDKVGLLGSKELEVGSNASANYVGAASNDVASTANKETPSLQPDVDVTPEIRGIVSVENMATIASEIPAQIKAILYKPGEVFKMNDVLVKFDCSLYYAQYKAKKAILNAKRKTHANNLRLEGYDAIGALDVDISKSEVDGAEAELSVTAVHVDRCKIVAPFNGRVVEWHAYPFESVSPEQKVIRILDDRKLILEVITPSKWMSWLKIGSEFIFYVDETAADYKAEVVRIGPVVDPVSHTIKIYGSFAGEPEGILPGMSGSAKFILQ